MAKFQITTLGCKVNQCESAGMARKLTDNGWQKAGGGEPADLVVVNTCAVTGKAAMQSRQALRQAVRENPAATVVATGCYAQIAPDALAAIDGVAKVLGTGEKMSLAEDPGRTLASGPKIRRVVTSRPFVASPPFRPGANSAGPALFSKFKTAAAPTAPTASFPAPGAPAAALRRNTSWPSFASWPNRGFLETVLTGIHMGCYGLDLSPATSLDALLAQMDADGAMARIRLSSIEPREITGAIVDRVADTDRFLPPLSRSPAKRR